MAIQPPDKLFPLLGLISWGDLGKITIYRSKRGKLVWLIKTWPKKPPSPTQVIQRAKYAVAAKAWTDLTPAQRQQWHLAARRASLTMHGYHLFISHQTVRDDACIKTIQRQTRTNLIPL